jgi:hypothetical protein
MGSLQRHSDEFLLLALALSLCLLAAGALRRRGVFFQLAAATGWAWVWQRSESLAAPRLKRPGCANSR